MGTRRLVSLVLAWQVSASLCYYAVFAATPFFRDSFALSGAAVGVIVTVLTLGHAAFLLPFGALADRFGEGHILVFGLAGMAAGAVLVTVAWTYAALLVAVFLLGALYSTSMPGTNRAIFGNVPPERQNLAVGVKQVGVTGGSAVSAVLVTGIAGVLSWEAGFYVAAGVALLVAAAFGAAYRGSGDGGAAEYPDFRVLARNRPYRALVAAGFFLGGALFTTTGYTIIYVEEVVGASVALGGVVLAAMQVAGSVGRVAVGWLGDVLPGEPRRRTGGILLAQTLGAAALFVAVAFADGPWVTAGAFVALGFFVLGLTGIYYSCLGTVVGPDEMGGATAGGQLAVTGGALVAPPAFGALADAAGYRASWLLLSAAVAAAAVFVVRVIRTDSPREVVAAAG